MLTAFTCRRTAVFAFLLLSLSSTAQKKGSATDPHILNPSPITVAWGYYWSEASPVLRIRSGDYVKVHTLITSNPERLEGAGVRPDQVEKELRDVQAVKDRGPGGHVLTGPIWIEEAEPGDVLCSIAADVNITQLVDGNVGVHAMLPKGIFVKD